MTMQSRTKLAALGAGLAASTAVTALGLRHVGVSVRAALELEQAWSRLAAVSRGGIITPAMRAEVDARYVHAEALHAQARIYVLPSRADIVDRLSTEVAAGQWYAR